MRVFLFIKYDGSKFQGFQEQPSKNSVMDKIVFACKELGIDLKPIGSSRTDSGVHALNQVVHLDIPPFWSDFNKLRNKLNHLLSPSVYVNKILHVSNNIHARFDAKKRLYRYVCYTGRYNPLLNDYALFLQNFDLKSANESLSLFLGTHNFGFFKKEGSQTKNDIRTLYRADVYKYGKFIVFRFLGDGFLRSQIRMMIAAILAVQKGDLSLENLKAQIEMQKKIHTRVAGACGLYLSRVYYESFDL